MTNVSTTNSTTRTAPSIPIFFGWWCSRRIRALSLWYATILACLLAVVRVVQFQSESTQYDPTTTTTNSRVAVVASSEPTTSSAATPSTTSRTLSTISSAHAPCPVKDVSRYNLSENRKHDLHLTARQRDRSWPQCLRFQCRTHVKACNNYDETDYDGSEPPCCTHLMRDMAREVDKILCFAGVEMFPAFGMLLGLIRDDKIIPWTSDNDYLANQQNLALLYEKWNESEAVLHHGLALFWVTFDRICITDKFAGGALAARWKSNETIINYDEHLPYADIFIGDREGDEYVDERFCRVNATDVWPTVRRPVYNGSFYLTFPNTPEAMLRATFGDDWRFPDKKKSRHGVSTCKKPKRRPRRPTRRKSFAKPKSNKKETKIEQSIKEKPIHSQHSQYPQLRSSPDIYQNISAATRRAWGVNCKGKCVWSKCASARTDLESALRLGLKRWEALTDALNVTTIATFGSLIAARYRNTTLMKYDTDIDYWMWFTDMIKLEAYATTYNDKFQKSHKSYITIQPGWRHKFLFKQDDPNKNSGGRRYDKAHGVEFVAPVARFRQIVGAKRIHIDIWPLYPDGCTSPEQCQTLKTQNAFTHVEFMSKKYNYKQLPRDDIFPLQSCYLEGVHTSCPANPNAIFDKLYGGGIYNLTQLAFPDHHLDTETGCFVQGAPANGSPI